MKHKTTTLFAVYFDLIPAKVKHKTTTLFAVYFDLIPAKVKHKTTTITITTAILLLLLLPLLFAS